MERIYNLTKNLVNDVRFSTFQNDIIQETYESLGQSFSNDENEIQIVERLVGTLNGKEFKNTNNQIKLTANKIHGSKSLIGFNCQNKYVIKELGDMVVIAIITQGRTRLLQRICIIQNKKAEDQLTKGSIPKKKATNNQKWNVDHEQLFLLKNFPPFKGERGIFRGISDLTFLNRSGCLGAFGLLSAPGEMGFISAPFMAEFLRNRNVLSASDIGLHAICNDPPNLPSPCFDSSYWDELSYFILRRRFILPYWDFSFPFLGNFRFGRDIYDFIRAWTQISVGEFTCCRKEIINREVDSFANNLLKSAGLGKGIDLPTKFESKFEADIAIFLLHIDIREEE